MSIREHLMNIAILIPVPPSKHGFTNNVKLQQAISCITDEITYVFTDTPYPYPIKGCEVVPIRSDFLFPLRLARKAKNLGVNILNIPYIYSLYGNGKKGSMILISSAFNILTILVLCRLYRIKSVLTIHSVITNITKESTLKNYKNKKYLNCFIGIFNSLLCKLPYTIVTLSKFQGEALSKFVNDQRLYIIPHGMDTGPVFKMDHSFFTFLFFGMIRPNKGILVLLSAFQQFAHRNKSAKLVIAGGYIDSHIKEYEEYFQKVKTRISEMTNFMMNVEFRDGWISEQDAIELISASDCIVLPYVDTANEVSGVVASFSFLGVPFIVSDIIRFRAIMSEEEALFVPPGNDSALCQAMEKIFSDSKMRMRMTRALISKANNYSWKKIAQQYIQVYEKLLTG